MTSWKGKLLLAIVPPVVMFGLLEHHQDRKSTRLNSSHLGAVYPADFVLPAEVDGEPVWIENPFFTYQIFSPPIARTPAPFVVKQRKDPDSLRIVVLGESAAQGDPVPPFGPPRMLEFALRHMLPDARVEVINAAVTAINSHVIRGIARDLDKLKPDVVILYIGNNEIIGPYGPGTVFAGFAESDGMIRFATALNRLRLVQVFRSLVAIAGEARKPEEFKGVSMFMDRPVPFDDPRLEAVRRRYRANLEEIIREANDAGAAVLLSTVAVNFTDCPPSISVHRPGLDAAARAAWTRAYDRGVAAVRSNEWATAVSALEEAAAIDDHHAELSYWLGMAYAGAGRADDARVAYTRAMDRDAFRYRTDSALNAVVRARAADAADPLPLADADAAFRGHATYTDRDLFIDHVHFSFAGTAVLTETWARELFELPALARWSNRRPFPDIDWLQNEMMFTAVAEIDVIQRMLARFAQPPFDRQLDIETRIAPYRERVGVLTEALRSGADDAIPAAFAQRMRAYPDDLFLPVQLAQYFVSFNRYSEARAVLEPALARHPHRRGPRAILAHLLAMEGRTAEAAEMLLGRQEKQGFFATAETTHLVNALLPAGYHDEAAAVAGEVERRVRPLDYRWRIARERAMLEQVRDRYRQARVLIEQGQIPMAEQLLGGLIAMRRDLGDVLYWLGVIQGMKGDPASGFAYVQRAIGYMGFARAYYHGALWQAKNGAMEQAQGLLEQAARHAHEDDELVNSLAWLWGADSREQMRAPEKAREVLARALTRTHEPKAVLLDTSTALYAIAGEVEAARAESMRAETRARAEGNEPLLAEILARRMALEKGQASGWGRLNRPMQYY